MTRKSVGGISLNDVEENLCDGCYKGFTGSLDEAVPGWKRMDVLRRQETSGEENQISDFDDCQQGPDDW